MMKSMEMALASYAGHTATLAQGSNVAEREQKRWGQALELTLIEYMHTYLQSSS